RDDVRPRRSRDRAKRAVARAWGYSHAKTVAGLGRDGTHEELEPDQTFVKLAKRLAMPLIVQPHTLEVRRVEVLQRPEVLAVGRRDFGDESSRFARPRVDAPEPHAERRERQHHRFFP